MKYYDSSTQLLSLLLPTLSTWRRATSGYQLLITRLLGLDTVHESLGEMLHSISSDTQIGHYLSWMRTPNLLAK